LGGTVGLRIDKPGESKIVEKEGNLEPLHGGHWDSSPESLIREKKERALNNTTRKETKKRALKGVLGNGRRKEKCSPALARGRCRNLSGATGTTRGSQSRH